VALVRERAIQTERPPLVGEVSANVCGCIVPRGQRDGSLSRILDFLNRDYRIKKLEKAAKAQQRAVEPLIILKDPLRGL
jgi:hypothetical protein